MGTITGKTKWKQKMELIGEAAGHTVTLDAKAPIGGENGFTPKELVVLGVCGCTALDVVALLKKYRQTLEHLDVSAEVATTEKGHPAVFTKIELLFDVRGKIEKDKIIEAVRLSQTAYCGVSAMLSKSAPIHYRIVLNGEEIFAGESAFK